MHITFDVSKFDSNSLINILYYLRKNESSFNHHDSEITKITCRTPSAAYKYTRYVATSGLDEQVERVFLKNPKIGIKYLIKIRRKEFKNPDIQKRFWKKILKNPRLAYEWSSVFGRLNKEEEEIFINDIKAARDYALFVLKGRFNEKIHNAIVLKSFELKDSWEKKLLQEYIKYAEAQQVRHL